MAAAEDISLDVPEPQILLNFPGDANGFFHHHRLLLKRLSPGRWIALSPDYELETIDLNARQHIVLGRRSPFPAHLLPEIYAFDVIPRGDLESYRRRAATMAVVLGDEDMQEIQSQSWVFSDPQSSKLGTEVRPDALANAVFMGNRGLVEVDGAIEGIEEIPSTDVSGFADKMKGTQGELRTIGTHIDSQGKRFISLSDAFPLMRQSELPDWTFEGPRATQEMLSSVLQGTADLTSYHLQWIQHSGVNQKSSISHEHKCLIECLRLAICRDQLDVTNLMSMELLTRRIIQLELAVSRNPSSPEFGGLELLMEAPISVGGAASVRAVDTWLTARLKEQANIQKQTRLYREEQAMKYKDKTGGGGGGDDQPSAWRRKNRPKAKAKSGPSASGGVAGEA